MQAINYPHRQQQHRKRNYSSIYSLEDNCHSFFTNKKKQPKLSSSLASIDFLGKENTPTPNINKSIDYDLHFIQKNFTQMRIDQSLTTANDLTADFEMAPLLDPYSFRTKNSSVDWSKRFDDFDSDDTLSSTINYENDIPVISKNATITGKIIANAIESEKTLNRIFEMNPQLIPNDRNALVVYDRMKEYKERFESKLFVLNCRANGLGLGFNMNDPFDECSMDIPIDTKALNEFFDDDMVID